MAEARPDSMNTRKVKRKVAKTTLLCLAVCLALLFAAAASSPGLRQLAQASLGSLKALAASQGASTVADDTAGGGPENSATTAATQETEAETAKRASELASIDPCWHPLLARLEADGLYGADVANWFANMPEAYSAKPMGVKISTLFRRKFIPPYFPYFNKPTKPQEIYPGVVTQDNIRKCYEFLNQHRDIFQQAEDKYFVPKEVLVSLLMVETRLGNFIGSEQAFWSLASMASAVSPEHIEDYLSKLPVTDEHAGWLADILEARSTWAYTELKALIVYSRLHEHNPLDITGSIYGAIGLCQFMPSNISFYAVDGNGDGRIDLFSLEDAVPSAANFLKSHGWRKNTTGQKRVKMLKYYNHSTAYANTILGLADGVDKYKPARAESGKASQAATSSKPAKKS